MDAWVVEILKTYGLAGVVIIALAAVCGILWRRIVAKDTELAKLNTERADERAEFVKLIEIGNSAALLRANAAERQNVVLGGLGTAITEQSGEIERYHDRVESQAEMLKEKFADFRHVVDSFGESNRVVSGLIAEVRSVLGRLEAAVNQVAIAIAAQGRGA